MVSASAPFDRNVDRWNRYCESFKGRVRTEQIFHNLELHIRAIEGKLRILDAGCGLGEIASLLACKSDRMVLLDFSANMLGEARKRLAETLSAAELEPFLFVHGCLDDIELDLPAGSFDLILCHNVLEYVSNPQATLAALVGRLAPDGLLSLVAANRFSEAFKLAYVKLDFKAARLAFEKPDTTAHLFDEVPKLTFSISELEEMVRTFGLSLLGTYGIRVFTDYLPEHVTDDPANEQLLLDLEKASSDVQASLHVARYLHLICRK